MTNGTFCPTEHTKKDGVKKKEDRFRQLTVGTLKTQKKFHMSITSGMLNQVL